jgi:DNA-3-methyladenine glycosylase I
MQRQSELKRCDWADTPLSIEYHDVEWGVPSRDDRHLFEHIVLEGAQAGLSWELILRKRSGYRRAFAEFDIDRVAGFGEDKVEELANDASIVRNRQKIWSAISNARAAALVREQHGSLAEFLWDLAGRQTVHNSWTALSQLPARNDVSQRMSKELMKRGFKFVGPIGMYSFMQAVGMINDHLVSCPRYQEIRNLEAS